MHDNVCLIKNQRGKNNANAKPRFEDFDYPAEKNVFFTQHVLKST